MANQPNKRKRQASPKAGVKRQRPIEAPSATPEVETVVSKKPNSMDNLKNNLSGKRKAIFEILDDVKKVNPNDWKDANQVEQMAKSFANKLGLPVPEQRIKQFVKAYTDATKNGPDASVDELVKKYGKNVDDKTLKEIKKFVPKSKG
ncbi:hypothetical protein NZD89_27405 [Alicyclobacillus fastidiosus]|uniref:Uncharacterized protein n=1 Tax=Alicyclobacillus fastidiosus TaxID=392011 RepID=A0ABY6ZH08_9BACL|nr:hypothetical protein [Alicyclobacillus fastidiosus]WAH41883.1 hypothetical protein NZD89_27405 [Alicyclobacillus fastidiosus]GMA63594.1 hypothetical protein GCM10025859_40340 [Alicyclobacillus fastidiosus]